MDIIRAGLDDTMLFESAKLNRGGCCFYTEDKANTYFFEIDGQKAILRSNAENYFDDAIDEFLFYSGFITLVTDCSGNILRQLPPKALRKEKISSIQPTQFYINARKLENCTKWIKSLNDIIIPVTKVDNHLLACDGHTRIRAAIDLGYDDVYVFDDDFSEYLGHFADEARLRGIFQTSQMEIISDSEYKVKWHKFCDDFFGNKQS